MEEYDQMVAKGIERQKFAEKEANNNIRDNYMDRLGVNKRNSEALPGSGVTSPTLRNKNR